jgi:hypothetical protein
MAEKKQLEEVEPTDIDYYDDKDGVKLSKKELYKSC